MEHISVLNVLRLEEPRYHNGKGNISINPLGVSSRDMKFIYVLPIWEGVESNLKVLYDAISKMNGLIVQHVKKNKNHMVNKL